MGAVNPLMKVFGTEQGIADPAQVRAGDFSCLVLLGGLRSIKWQNTEIIRGLEASIRDENWGTYPQDEAEENWTENGALTIFSRRFTVANRALSGKLTVTFDPEGQFLAALALTASKTFSTNRAGFTLLHPLAGVAGKPVEITHGNGEITRAYFPTSISPHQPFLDIAKIVHRVDDVDVSIRFEGEIFEMEDHRNWTDASFKTYCRPLAEPFPYIIEAGATVYQKIAISVGARKDTAPSRPPEHSQRICVAAAEKNRSVLPDILLAVEQAWKPDPTNSIEQAALKGNGWLVRLDENYLHASAWSGPLAQLAEQAGAYCDVEIVVPKEASPAPYLKEISGVLSRQGIVPRHVLAIPETYLKTLPSNAPIPSGASLKDCIIGAQAAFPDAVAGAGMLTNFTELNRSRPADIPGAYISHATSAIVHAADDISVFETLEALPAVFATTNTFSAGRPERLGLMAIGMRSNPYGQRVADNPENIRKAMAQNDPRQAGLFGAAFGTGVAACATQAGCQALALAGIGGPFALEDGSKLFPLFHVIKSLCAMAGKRSRPLRHLPAHIYGLAAERSDGSVQAILANCSLAPRPVEFARPVKFSCLDKTRFKDAANDPNWLSNTEMTRGDAITFDPCAVAFLEMEAGQ